VEVVLLDANGSGVKEPNAINDIDYDAIDAEYEALCAEYSLVLV